MARLDPAQAAQKYGRNTGAAGQSYNDGINSVTTAPGQLAAQQQAAMLQNLTMAVNSGRWASRVSAVSLADWKQRTLAVGSGRYTQGTQAAVPRMQAAFQRLFPHIEQVRSSLPPRGGLEQNINRAIEMMRGMSQYKQ